ncbi:MAG: EF-P lysine aminoacylase GenX [Deltaproteobacteria bacterium]|nr:EF-P lysine aminoacylase GenX [Deltaproteobacteria bacterium]MBW1949482.1 EF-P lysine aminoacylase GenX [Deltaproteobacteria bacterium]
MSPGSNNRAPATEALRLRARRPYLLLRARLIQALRSFFEERGYLEVETPHLVREVAPEAHIEPVAADGGLLHTSPELCMKRLLAAGYSRIFQVARCFRKGERGSLHLQEFTLLEWYRAEADYRDMMEECELLMRFVCRRLGLGEQFRYRDRPVDLRGPWERISVSEAFERWAEVSAQEAVERGLFDDFMVDRIEPRLKGESPVFLYDYPAPLAALARLKPGASHLAERFELYVGGVELANAFSELKDPAEQERRFRKERRARETAGRMDYGLPRKFLRALDAMPDAAGIALGVDRLAMILADRGCIDDVVTFTPDDL